MFRFYFLVPSGGGPHLGKGLRDHCAYPRVLLLRASQLVGQCTRQAVPIHFHCCHHLTPLSQQLNEIRRGNLLSSPFPALVSPTELAAVGDG